MSQILLDKVVECVPPGDWAVGVSGGADSVALLSLLRRRRDLRLVVVHLNHQVRGEASEGDAAFVGELSGRWGVECVMETRATVEGWRRDWPANVSARFRAMRLELFRRVVEERQLSGVILAHQREDRAETVMQRLLRGGAFAGLAGMQGEAIVRGVRVLRPLLGVSREHLRKHLREQGITWREDASNASPVYQRNRVRHVLAGRHGLMEGLVELAGGCAALSRWVKGAAPVLGETFAMRELGDLPEVLAAEAGRRWLVARGAVEGDLSSPVIGRLVEMARDAASAAHQDFPGRVTVSRRRGWISARKGAGNARPNGGRSSAS